MKTYKPTTPSRRHARAYDFSGITKIKPMKSLTAGFHKKVGRNNHGRITGPHRGGGVKRRFRDIDFKQQKFEVPAKVAAIEYDPNRTARIARLHYVDGDRRYILASLELKEGDTVVTSEKAPIRPSNRMKLKNIPQGTMVHNVELHPGRGGMVVRSAGSAATVMAIDGKLVQLQMPSSEVRIFPGDSYASIGRVSNQEHSSIKLGKAGRSRWLGRRPKVRGTAKNPNDHPYGGGEGRQGRGTRRPKTATGKVTGGRKTRDAKKKSNKFIVRRRKHKKRK